MRDNMVLLEPWMRLQVQVPDDYAGSIIADISSRRGSVQNFTSENRVAIIEAFVPLAGMFDYADKVRSLSQGRANSSMEPFRYQPAPDEVLQRLLHPEDFM
jgi:elongation factor G